MLDRPTATEGRRRPCYPKDMRWRRRRRRQLQLTGGRGQRVWSRRRSSRLCGIISGFGHHGIAAVGLAAAALDSRRPQCHRDRKGFAKSNSRETLRAFSTTFCVAFQRWVTATAKVGIFYHSCLELEGRRGVVWNIGRHGSGARFRTASTDVVRPPRRPAGGGDNNTDFTV